MTLTGLNAKWYCLVDDFRDKIRETEREGEGERERENNCDR